MYNMYNRRPVELAFNLFRRLQTNYYVSRIAERSAYIEYTHDAKSSGKSISIQTRPLRNAFSDSTVLHLLAPEARERRKNVSPNGFFLGYCHKKKFDHRMLDLINKARGRERERERDS